MEEGLQYKKTINWLAGKAHAKQLTIVHTCSLSGWQAAGDLFVGNNNIFRWICNCRYHSHEPPTPRRRCFWLRGLLDADDYGSFWLSLAGYFYLFGKPLEAESYCYDHCHYWSDYCMSTCHRYKHFRIRTPSKNNRHRRLVVGRVVVSYLAPER